MWLWALGALAGGWALAHLMLRPKSAGAFTIAHRGAASLAPENTLLGVRKAIEVEAAYTEIDIRRAADGALVVMHDQSLKRTTGKNGNVEDITAEEITQLRTRSGFDAPLTDERVPTLDAVLRLVAGEAISLVIEVKDPATYPGIENQLAEAIRRTRTAGKVIVGSFDHGWLPAFRALMPETPVMPIADWWTKLPADPALTAVDVDWRRVALDPTFARRMRAQGRRVFVWTVDIELLTRLMIWLGVDGITTNRPDVCQRALGR